MSIPQCVILETPDTLSQWYHIWFWWLSFCCVLIEWNKMSYFCTHGVHTMNIWLHTFHTLKSLLHLFTLKRHFCSIFYYCQSSFFFIFQVFHYFTFENCLLSLFTLVTVKMVSKWTQLLWRSSRKLNLPTFLLLQSLDHPSLWTVQSLQMTDFTSRQKLKGTLAMDLHGGRSNICCHKAETTTSSNQVKVRYAQNSKYYMHLLDF